MSIAITGIEHPDDVYRPTASVARDGETVRLTVTASTGNTATIHLTTNLAEALATAIWDATQRPAKP